MKRVKSLDQAAPSTKGRGAFKQREVKPEREPCGETGFWYCNVCMISFSGESATYRGWESHMLLHRAKQKEYPGPFGPALTLVKGRVGV